MIGVIDYGMGNLGSVANALAFLGAPARVLKGPDEMAACRALILPGVGAFGDCMANLRQWGYVEPLRAWMAADKPLLGICLGLQMLCESSEESPGVEGFGVVPSPVVKFAGGPGLKVPQIGWNALHIVKDDPLFKYIREGEYVYYVHSYYGKNCAESTLAVSDYSIPVTGAVRAGRVYGTQFHPEKSGDTGLRILKAFAEL